MTDNSNSTVDQTAKKVPGRPWPKGVSGNPNGRPKQPSFKELIQDLPGISKAEVVERMRAIAVKGRPSDAIRAADFLAKHSAEAANVAITSTDFTIQISPSSAMSEEEDEG